MCVVVLPSRIRSLTKAFGIEKVMAFHRALGVSLVLLVLGHIAAVLINDPRQIALLIPFLSPRAEALSVTQAPLLTPLLTPPYRSLAGLAATIGLVVLAGVSSRGRRYEHWRALHLAASGVVLAGTVLHTLLINHLVPTFQIINWFFDPLGYPVLHAAMQDPTALVYLGVLALAVIGVGVHRWVVRPLSRSASYQVTDIRRVTPAVAVLTLKNDRLAPRFRAGQFAWLRLHRDPFGEEHPFTVTSAEHDHSIEFTIRDTGSWTNQIPRLRPGDRVWVDGPHGNFTPADNVSNPMVLIAGGVGITPMLSILRTAAASGRHGHKRPILLILTDRGERLFRGELALLANMLSLSIEELNGERLSVDAITARVPDLWVADYYVCGSPSLVSAAVSALAEIRVSPDRIHTERFDL